MKSCLPASIIGCIALLPACHEDSTSLPELQAEFSEQQAIITSKKNDVHELRQTLASLDRQRSNLRQDIEAANKSLVKQQREINEVSDSILCLKDPARLVAERLKPGTHVALLTIGNNTYRDVTIKAFDGRLVTFSHADGFGRSEVPEYLQVEQTFEPVDLKSWKPPSLASLTIKPYVPLPRAAPLKPVAKKPKPRQKNYVQKNPINPKWPVWFRPGGWSFQGSSWDPIKHKTD
jgi:hypothetical protein